MITQEEIDKNKTQADVAEEEKAAETLDAKGTPAEDQDTEQEHEINGQDFTLIGTTKKGKGKGAGQPLFLLKVEPNAKDFALKVASAVGEENFWKNVVALIRTACKDSTLQMLSTATDGEPTTEGFNKAFNEWWTDDTRRSGPHVKDIKEKLQAIFAEVSPLMNRAFDEKAEPLSDEDRMKMLQLSTEFSDLQAKLEKIQGARKGKKGKAVAKAA